MFPIDLLRLNLEFKLKTLVGGTCLICQGPLAPDGRLYLFLVCLERELCLVVLAFGYDCLWFDLIEN